MRLLFVADGRSPIAQNWIQHFSERGDEVYLVSPFPCTPELRLNGLEIVPVAFSARQGRRAATHSTSGGMHVRAFLRHWLGPLTIRGASGRLRGIIERVKPDLVHALRIPYEGMLAADAYDGAPLIMSVWGNDFTLHAKSNGLMEHYTSWSMQVADGLHADCQRDIRLGRQLGFHADRATLVVPGNGGIRLSTFHRPAEPAEKPLILNPRGFRTYVRNDVFFEAIPKVLAKRPDAKFLCAAMAQAGEAERWVARLGIGRSVELLPAMPYEEMGDVFRRAQITVSLGVHDGTPNTLLEGMACGCLPVAGDLDSIREWIQPGQNGLLVNPNDPTSVADAIIQGLENKSLRQQAAGLNEVIIRERAEYGRCMDAATNFYGRVITQGGG